MTNNNSRKQTIRELAFLFLRLGTTAFGGPAAHIAMMEDEVVSRRKWLEREKFLDLLGTTNIIPGPNSTEMAIHVGHQRAGWAGLIVSGVCFIFPAFLIVLGFAWAYVRFGAMPQVEGFLYGVKAVILAVVVQALWRLARSAIKSIFLGIFCILSIAANILGVHELAVLFGTGFLVAIWRIISQKKTESFAAKTYAIALPKKLLTPAVAVAGASAAAPFSLLHLFLFFFKVGSILFGSGYVLLAFLRADMVERWHWLSEQQLLDAIAVGQVTPGPVFTTATFIGYILGSVPGAIVATIGIFLPAFFFVAVSGPIIPHLRRSPTVGAFLDGVIVSSLALMAVVTFRLGLAAIVDIPSAVLAILSIIILLRFKINSAWLVLSGGLLGLFITWL